MFLFCLLNTQRQPFDTAVCVERDCVFSANNRYSVAALLTNRVSPASTQKRPIFVHFGLNLGVFAYLLTPIHPDLLHFVTKNVIKFYVTNEVTLTTLIFYLLCSQKSRKALPLTRTALFSIFCGYAKLSTFLTFDIIASPRAQTVPAGLLLFTAENALFITLPLQKSPPFR